MLMMHTIADLTDEYVVYRDLEPCDSRLPGLTVLREKLGLAPGVLPRKREQAYAQVIAAIAAAAQQQRGGATLDRFLVIGDTENDRLLAHFLGTRGPQAAYGFIALEQLADAAQLCVEGNITTANRWALIDDWIAELDQQLPDWSRTAVLIDIDKTLLGPRGRNDAPIDEARAEGALHVARDMLADALDADAFCRSYAALCQKRYHGFTLDNQDYVTYTALLFSSAVYNQAAFDEGLAAGSIADFAALLDQTRARVPLALRSLHDEIAERVAQKNPTPFTAFRRAEFVATAARLSDGRLTMCNEVFSACMRLREAGALCLAASDKPAESALPTEVQRGQGLQALHHTPTVVR
jgi:hypothetical protein